MTVPTISAEPVPRPSSQRATELTVSNVFFGLVIAAVGAMVLGGNSAQLGLPIAPDRVLLALAAIVGVGHRDLRERLMLCFRPIHLAFLVPLAFAIGSALHAGTLTTNQGIFALLDGFGVVPFLLFITAPVLFDEPWRLRVLMAGAVVIGGYLGITAVLEVVGPKALVFPSYIVDPSLGTLFGRARGPFLQPAADGLILIFAMVMAAIGLRTWASREARFGAALVLGLTLVGCALTLTRSIWIAAGATVLVLAVTGGTARKYLLPAGVLLAVLVLCLVTFVAPVKAAFDTRVSDSRSALDRLNANAAAWRVVRERPLTGVGWQRFAVVEGDWVRQNPDYPLTNIGIAVHNVPLGYAAEIGLPGALSWLLVLAGATWGALRRRIASTTGMLWYLGLAAYLIAYGLVALLVPVNYYAMPNAVLWLWLGIVPVIRRKAGEELHRGAVA